MEHPLLDVDGDRGGRAGLSPGSAETGDDGAAGDRWSFFALAAYVTRDAGLSLLGVREPERSTVGIVLAAVSLPLMLFLSVAVRRTG